MVKLKSSVESREKELKDIDLKLLDERKELNTVTVQVGSHQKRLNVVTGAQDGQDFLDQLQEAYGRLKVEIKEAKRDLGCLSEAVSTKQSELTEVTSTLSEMTSTKTEIEGEIRLLEIEVLGCNNRKISAMEQSMKEQSDQVFAAEKLNKCLSTLLSKAGESRGHLHGLQAIRKILERGDIDGYYGVVADCFTCDNDLWTAISSVAGKRLFFHVVSTRRVATELVKIHRETGLKGEITCIPIDTIFPSRLKPEIETKLKKMKEGAPMMDLLEPTSPELEPALQWIFGRYVLVRNTHSFRTVQDATKDIQSVDCVTLEGDLSSRKGVLTGGYFGAKSGSKLAMYKQVEEARITEAKHAQTLQTIKEKLSQFDAEVQNSNLKLQTLKTKLNRLIQGVDDKEATKRLLKREVDELKSSLDHAKRSLEEKQAAKAEIVQTKEDLDLDQDQEDLAVKLKELQIAFRGQSKAVNRLEKKRSDLNNVLEMEMRPKMAELQRTVADKETKLETTGATCQRMMEMMEELAKIRTEHREKIESLSDTIETVVEKVREQSMAKDKALRKLDEANEAFAQMNLKHLSAASRKNRYQNLLETERENFAGLGNLPSSEMKKKADTMSSTHCKKRLEKAKKKVTELEGNINFKAAQAAHSLREKHHEFRDQLESLKKNREEVSEFLDTLNSFSEHKLNFTYAQICKYFAEVFAELAPPGSHGELCVEKRQISGESSQTFTSNDFQTQSDEEVVGIAINVRFRGSKTTQDIRNLSGGQKTVVALSLIFAFQKCGQSPFCILDEIDAALDTNCRKQLAEYIKSRSSNVQYICTTFRRELIESADSFIGVQFSSDSSQIKDVDAQEAHEFIC